MGYYDGYGNYHEESSEQSHAYRVGTLVSGQTYRCDCNAGDWLVVCTYDRPVLYKSDGTVVKNLNVYYGTGNRKGSIYCDGTWDYALVGAYSGVIPKVSDGTLMIGDSYVAVAFPNALGDEVSKQFVTGSWAKGHAGWTAEYIVGMILNLGANGTSEYDADYINSWKDGIFARAMIWCGANKGASETLAQNDISTSIPKVSRGSIADLLNGGTVTANGSTVSTIEGYYNLYSKNTVGQYAFLIEYLQALQPSKPIYMMGYLNFPNTANDSDFVIGICEQLENWYGVKFINSFKDMGINKRNVIPYTSDNVHPNAEGSKLYWQKVLEKNKII